VSTLKSGRHKISDQALNLYKFLGREHNYAPAISAADVSLPLLQETEKYLRINVLVRYPQRLRFFSGNSEIHSPITKPEITYVTALTLQPIRDFPTLTGETGT